MCINTEAEAIKLMCAHAAQVPDGKLLRRCIPHTHAGDNWGGASEHVRVLCSDAITGCRVHDGLVLVIALEDLVQVAIFAFSHKQRPVATRRQGGKTGKDRERGAKEGERGGRG